MRYTLVCVLVSFFQYGYSQNNFYQVYGNGGKVDTPVDVISNLNGGYFVLGNTSNTSYGESKMLLLNIDSIGSQLWSKTYTPNYFGGGIATSILQMDNGDMVLLGGSGGYLTDVHPYLFKININGDTLWSKFYKCDSPQYSYGSISLAEELFNHDLLFVTSYETNSDSVLLNNWYFNPSVISLVDSYGEQIWSNYYFTIDSAALKMTSSLVLEDSTVVLSGYTMGLDVSAVSHPFILKLNSDGTIIWDNILDTEAYTNGNYGDGLYEKSNGNIIWSTNHRVIVFVN
ncbi:MAG: hypothetical protein JKY53_11215 [Flavobacteriales bacterium]|nr:hypothetical protein [Flavobacteriales bacterium]